MAILSTSFSRTPQVVNDWYFFTTSGLTKPSRASVKSLDSRDGGAVTFTFDGTNDAAWIGAPDRPPMIKGLAVNGAGRCGARGTVPVIAGDQGEVPLRPCWARRLACPGISEQRS